MDRALGVAVAKDKQRMVGYGTYEQTVNTLAAAVSASDYIAGPDFTAADVYVGSHLMWGLEFDSLPRRPVFENYVARLLNRPAFAAAKAIDDDLAGGGESQQTEESQRT